MYLPNLDFLFFPLIFFPFLFSCGRRCKVGGRSWSACFTSPRPVQFVSSRGPGEREDGKGELMMIPWMNSQTFRLLRTRRAISRRTTARSWQTASPSQISRYLIVINNGVSRLLFCASPFLLPFLPFNVIPMLFWPMMSVRLRATITYVYLLHLHYSYFLLF